MHSTRSFVLGLALALALPAAAGAQTQDRTAGTGEAKMVTCRVTNLSAADRSFTADCPEGRMTFSTSSNTQFTKSSSGGQAGGAASMTDLKVGDQVRVSYSGGGQAGTGGMMTHTATRVEIMPAAGGQGGTQSGQTGTQPGQAGQTGQQPARTGQQAQTGSQQAQGDKVSGRVVSVDRSNRSFVLETNKGRETFRVDQGNTSVDFGQIREGAQVEVAFTGTGTDRRVTSLRMTERMGQTGAQPTEQPAGQRGQQQPAEQRAGQREGGQRVTGRIVNVENDRLVVETRAGRETFMVDPSSTQVDLMNFQEGDQVTVMYTGTGQNKQITSIQASGERRASQRGTGGSLPQTASPVPFIGLVGLFLLAAALGLRYVNRHA
ncbi:MAG TPA: hypothetical protein VJV23_14535 [Candidatus Polarisedimenticolia bacterium]|nr:hypothetical protein [Candidatus Polarisedimenticolia bacterium]